MAMAVMEGIILSFVLLLVCVINIKDGPVGGVHHYEPPVQERVVELGLIAKEQIKKNLALSSAALLVPLVVCIPLLVVFINGARSFKDAFLQLLVIYMICGAFDRIFIDWYWVGHTKAWFIPGRRHLCVGRKLRLYLSLRPFSFFIHLVQTGSNLVQLSKYQHLGDLSCTQCYAFVMHSYS